MLYQNCSNCSAQLNKMATRAKNRKTIKQLLFLQQWMEFEIMIQEVSLIDPLPKLHKLFGTVEDGHTKIEKTFKQLLLFNQCMDF